MNNNSKKLFVEDDDKEADDGDDHDKNDDRSTVKLSVIDAYGRRLWPQSWLHETVFEEYLPDLMDMCLFDFADKFCVGEREAWSGYDWESEEGKQWIIEEWQEFIEEVQASDQPISDQLQHEIDWYARNSKESESDGQFGESAPANHDPAEDYDKDSRNDDWLEQDDYISVAGAESGNNEEFAVEWSKDHDFSVLEEDYGPDVADVFDRLSTTYDSIVENVQGVTRAERPLISEEQMSRFNEQQRLAHDTVVRATTTDEIDRKLIVLIDLGGTGKSTTVNA
eukprot:scaffold46861_cov32-Attheya_sp.AAC.1